MRNPTSWPATWLCLALTAVATGQEPEKPKAAVVRRIAIGGRVVDEAGRPVAFVTVGAARANEDFPLHQAGWRTIADAEGRFALPPLNPGVYDVGPIHDLDVVAGQTRPEQLPEAERAVLLAGRNVRITRDLPAAFLPVKVTLVADQPAPELVLRAIPHATFAARFIDGQGRPAPAGRGYILQGHLDDGAAWDVEFRPVPGQFDALTAMVPLGLRELTLHGMGDNVWWTWAPGTPRQPIYNARLKVVDDDRPAIIAQRLRSATLEIRLKVDKGELPADLDVGVYYPRDGGVNGGAYGGPVPDRVAPGVYRLDQGLLVGRDTNVDVVANGFKNLSTRPFRFTEEGQVGVVELTFAPGVREAGMRLADAVVLKTPEGRPIPQPGEPTRAIACRAVDHDTGRPVAGAAVIFSMEQSVDEDGDREFRTFEGHEAVTDADGRFTVHVPEKYLPDPAPKRRLTVRVEVRHPKYVHYFDDTADTREIAEEGISDAFPAFRLVRLIPARIITGRLLGPDGSPLADVDVDKHYDNNDWPSDVEIPRTDTEGRFRANVPRKAGLDLEFRVPDAARNRFHVPADRTDLGDLRLTRGTRVVGRVFDVEGKPAKDVCVTIPKADVSEAIQPSSLTDAEGRFRTDELPPGRYLVHVVGTRGKGDFSFYLDPPGVFIDQPLEIKAAGPPEITQDLRPVESVRLVARYVDARADDDDLPLFGVRGKLGGVDWAPGLSLDPSKAGGVYAIRAPKGLNDASLSFFTAERFRPGPDAPELFGPGYRLGRIDADRPEFLIRRHKPTTLKVRVAPEGVKVEARYVRQAEMEAAGVVFDRPMPDPIGVAGADLRYIVLPDEEIELVATAPGLAPARARVRLDEGKTVELVLAPGAAR